MDPDAHFVKLILSDAWNKYSQYRKSHAGAPAQVGPVGGAIGGKNRKQCLAFTLSFYIQTIGMSHLGSPALTLKILMLLLMNSPSLPTLIMWRKLRLPSQVDCSVSKVGWDLDLLK